MPRLIDADEFKKENARLLHCDFPYICEDTLEELIDYAPTVDVEPVRHGRWIKRSKVYPDFPYDSTYTYECSNCGYTDTHGEDVEVPFCWHCGAKMDEVEE